MSTAISADRAVGQLVAEQPARSQVFEQFGIDYCCGGKKTLLQACDIRGLDVANVALALEALDRIAPMPETDWTSSTLAALTEHIVSNHHGYLRIALPRLTMLIDKVVNAHGAKDDRLAELQGVFRSFRQEMELHMAKEEDILFPMLQRMELGGNDTLPAKLLCRSIINPIRVMLAEHDDAGAALTSMRDLTEGFSVPEGACNTYRAMLAALAELECDLHQHVHLENNVLFPRAIAEDSATRTAA